MDPAQVVRSHESAQLNVAAVEGTLVLGALLVHTPGKGERVAACSARSSGNSLVGGRLG